MTPGAVGPRMPSRRTPEEKLARQFFNDTWGLLRKKRRTKAESLAMVHGAHASRHLWQGVGGPREWAIGEWQVSRVYAALKRPEAALLHAKEAVAICRRAGLGGWRLASALEGLARAHASAGDRAACERALRQARAALAGEEDAGDRELIEAQLSTVRVPRR